ncbi:MAG: DUF4083 domain-containing protein [Paenisporosarcina sp.]
MHNSGDIFTTLVFLTLLFLGALGAISFTLFIRRILVNSQIRNNHAKDMEQKLDKILDLLEKKPN